MWGETTRVENRGETTRGKRPGVKRLGAKRLVTVSASIQLSVFPLLLSLGLKYPVSRGFETFFMLNSAEH